MDLFKILDGTPEPPIVNLTTSQNTSGDYWLPVAMCEYQKELADQVISLHYSDILKYFETDDRDRALLDSLEVLYMNSQFVATHPYLLISHYLPKNLTAKDVPANLCDTSGKFQVLKDVIALLEDRPINIGIVARSGKTLDLIEALLLGTKTNIKRHHGNYLKDPAKSKTRELTTHIFPSDAPGFVSQGKVDLVISFDTTPRQSFLEGLKKTAKTPILRFVSANSIDHVSLYFRQHHESKTKEYLVDVTAAIVVLRDRVGVLPPDLRPIYSKNLTYLKEWFQDFENKPWPLPEMSSIRKYDSYDVEKSLLSEVHYEKPAAQQTQQSYYESKRLRGDYTTNPLRDVKFGILSVDSNYTDALTHKLIQDFNAVHDSHELQKKEFEHFNKFKSSETDYTITDEAKLLKDVDHINSRLEVANTNASTLEAKIEEAKKHIIELEAEVERLNTNSKMRRIEELKDSIVKQEAKKKSLITETEYMTKEIENATKASAESSKENEVINETLSTNRDKVESYWDSYEEAEINRTEYNDLQEKIGFLHLQIEQNLRKLQNSKVRNEKRKSPSVK